jgi:hypothetical protein
VKPRRARELNGQKGDFSQRGLRDFRPSLMDAASRPPARSHPVPYQDESLSFAHSHHPLPCAALALSSASVFSASRAKAACARDERTNIPIDCSEVKCLTAEQAISDINVRSESNNARITQITNQKRETTNSLNSLLEMH